MHEKKKRTLLQPTKIIASVAIKNGIKESA